MHTPLVMVWQLAVEELEMHSLVLLGCVVSLPELQVEEQVYVEKSM